MAGWQVAEGNNDLRPAGLTPETRLPIGHDGRTGTVLAQEVGNEPARTVLICSGRDIRWIGHASSLQSLFETRLPLVPWRRLSHVVLGEGDEVVQTANAGRDVDELPQMGFEVCLELRAGREAESAPVFQYHVPLGLVDVNVLNIRPKFLQGAKGFLETGFLVIAQVLRAVSVGSRSTTGVAQGATCSRSRHLGEHSIARDSEGR